jgi:carboxypeptidase D
MLYIEQPVGTGFTQGTPNIENENDLAEQFVGFLQQFFKVFPELEGKKTYITGESVRLGSYSPWVLGFCTLILNVSGCYAVCRDVRSL